MCSHGVIIDTELRLELWDETNTQLICTNDHKCHGHSLDFDDGAMQWLAWLSL
jgi:hypothetical protein